MDLSAPIAYNGITFSPPTASPTTRRRGCTITDIEPSSVSADGYLDDRALQDGLDAADVYRRGRYLSISAAVDATSKGDLWDQVQALSAAFSPTLAYSADETNKGFLPLDFRQPTIDTTTWTAGYIPLRYYARPTNDIRYSISRVRTSDDGRGLTLPVTMQLVCRDPRKYLQTERTLAITTSTQTVTYRGDYPTLPVVTVTSSAAGASDFTVVVDSTSLVIDLSTRTAYSLYLDFSDRTLLDYPGSSYARLIVSAPDYPPTKAGTTVRMANTTGVSACVLTYREAWA